MRRRGEKDKSNFGVETMGIFKFKKSEKYFLAIDLGTTTIKILLFERKNPPKFLDKKLGLINGNIVILKSFIQRLEPFGIFDSSFFETEVLKKAFLKAIKGVVSPSESEINPKYAVLSFSANILKSQIFFKSLKRKNPKEKIQKKEAESITNNILTQAKKTISQEFTQKTGILAKDIHFLNLEVLEIKIDGYEVFRLVGFAGGHLNFRLIATFLIKYELEKVKQIIQGLDFEILRIIDPAENLVSAIGDKNLSGIFLDVGGEISKIVIIINGKTQWISGFDGGGDNFSKTLSLALGMSRNEAENFKIKYAKKVLSEQVRERIKEILSKPTQKWFNDLKFMFRKVQENLEILPPSIFIFGGGSLLPEIQEILSTGDWEELPFLERPTVKFLLPNDLKNIEDSAKLLTSPQNIPSLLIC